MNTINFLNKIGVKLSETELESKLFNCLKVALIMLSTVGIIYDIVLLIHLAAMIGHEFDHSYTAMLMVTPTSQVVLHAIGLLGDITHDLILTFIYGLIVMTCATFNFIAIMSGLFWFFIIALLLAVVFTLAFAFVHLIHKEVGGEFTV